METKIEQLRAKADLLMTTLTAHPKEDATWQITVNFSSYLSLYTTVSDLMKLCTVALNVIKLRMLSPSSIRVFY